MAALLTAGIAVAPAYAHAATTLPGAADAGRVQARTPDGLLLKRPNPITSLPELAPNVEPPKTAKSIHLTLKGIRIEGTTAYTPETLIEPYKDMIGTAITLDRLWAIAGEITARYRNDGYFLSRAYVPAQEVGDGTVILRVVEGYIKTVEIDDTSLTSKPLFRQIIDPITSERPARYDTMESQLLLLNDLPGLGNYQGTLAPINAHEDGAVKLILSHQSAEAPRASLRFDNDGSQYLGPQEFSANWSGALLPLQSTSFSGQVSAPTRELAAITASHRIPITPRLAVELGAGYARSEPGYTLSVQDIRSRSINASIGAQYQLIRQRRQNAKLGLSLDARNSSSTILGSDLSKDRIRALRLSSSYDSIDSWQGYNLANVTLSQGLGGLGASDAGDSNLSRLDARPDFTKLTLDLKRLQGITPDWSVLLAVGAQKASGSLFSSEEFGYGGQGYGRAYDQSEITGDDGIASSIELRYQSLPPRYNVSILPYGFYDIGRVWNDNAGQQKIIDASSAGAGVRLAHTNGLNAALQVAFPLTKAADAPLYDANGKNPRLSFQLGYEF